jgi:glycosyltransferase involved in cell wall biosynthesis
MKINVSVVGRYHAFDLAKQLEKHGILNKLITTYPKFKAQEWNIKKEHIVSGMFLEILNRYKKIIPFFKDETITFWINKIQENRCIKYLNNIDVFIGFSSSSLETLIAAKRLGVVTIIERGSAHYSYQMKVLQSENKKFIPNYKFWQQELLEYELADYISLPSSFSKKTFLENGVPEDKLFVNPYGVDLSQFKQIVKKDKIFRVIFCGKLSIQKGSHYLLQAIYELDLENFEFWHIGGISEEMKSLIKKYESPKIIYKGSYPQVKLYEFYSQGSVFILPSMQDGFGMVIFQAMACGLPVILSENTGAYDVVTKEGKEGFVIPIRSVDAIKEKIIFLYKNPKICKKMGEEAKKRVLNGFSWDDYGNRYVKFLKEIKANNG